MHVISTYKNATWALNDHYIKFSIRCYALQVFNHYANTLDICYVYHKYIFHTVWNCIALSFSLTHTLYTELFNARRCRLRPCNRDATSCVFGPLKLQSTPALRLYLLWLMITRLFPPQMHLITPSSAEDGLWNLAVWLMQEQMHLHLLLSGLPCAPRLAPKHLGAESSRPGRQPLPALLISPIIRLVFLLY
jgi:hypothetical protein